MIDGDEIPLLFEWPRGKLKRWLVALGTFAALLLSLYLIFSWLGLEQAPTPLPQPVARTSLT